MRYKKEDLQLLEDIGRLFKLDDIFLQAPRTYQQAEILSHIQEYSKGDWHDGYILATKGIRPNPGREHKLMMDALDTLQYSLKQNYTLKEQEAIQQLQELQERLSTDELEGDILKPKELLDYYTKEATRWMELVNFSDTKIDDLLVSIRKMIKTGE